MNKHVLLNAVVFLVTLGICLAGVELLLRVRHANQANYTIEMWRYAKTLKIRSEDPELDFEHRTNTSSQLQGVEIRLNSLGMRGPEPDLDNAQKRIVFLGSSNTLGWGVPEEESMTSLLAQALQGQAQVLNAGIGNYNSHRYVRLFEKRLLNLKPDVVVVHYFLNDAEALPAGRDHFLLKHSHLAVLVHSVLQVLKLGPSSIDTLVEHYESIYDPEHPGRQSMERALHRLDKLSDTYGFKVILALTPDIHHLTPYPFKNLHLEMQKISEQLGWTYVDFTEALSRVPAEELWSMQGDPHLNPQGHNIMAQELLPHLK